MMNTDQEISFDSAIKPISKHLKTLLFCVEDEIKNECCEIRLRRNRPVVLMLKNRCLFLHNDGAVSAENKNTYICSGEELSDTFSRMCSFSIHSHLSDVIEGFVTVEGGHRAGVVGTASLDKKGDIVSVRDVTSINIRVARNILNCSEEIFTRLYKNETQSIIIAGPPSGGKTTILRDLVRKISDSGVKISVIDERNEIALKSGKSEADLGINTDIFSGYPKTRAISTALRTMSPQIIAVDEVCEEDEIKSISKAANCGVKMIVTVHASSYNEILTRPQIFSLINTYSFDKLVLLMGADNPGKISGIYDIRELRDEILRCSIGLALPFDDRDKGFISA